MVDADLPIVRNGSGDPTPRTYVVLPDKGPTVLRYDCETVFGCPKCMGRAGGGPQHCTCDTLSPEDHRFCEREAHRQVQARDYGPCEDCAFRKGSPEQESGALFRILEQGVPFHCHRGMPMRVVAGEPEEYVPRRDRSGVPTNYPVCMGWLRAYLARSEKEPAA